jgi:hypothetical protein
MRMPRLLGSGTGVFDVSTITRPLMRAPRLEPDLEAAHVCFSAD